MESFIRELRLSFRSLRRAPGTAVVAIVALAIGIGLTTMMFSVVWGVLVRGLPFDQPHELVRLTRTNASRGSFNLGVTIHDFADWRAQQRSFDDLAGFRNIDLNLSDDDHSPQRISGALIDPVAFALLDVRPILGRVFTREESRPGAERLILIGWGIWQQRFGGDPDIVSRTVRVDGEPAVVIGVMPRGFAFPFAQEAWIPLRMDPVQIPRGQGPGIQAFGRLREGVSLDAARADMDRIAQRLAAEYPATNEGIGARIYPYTEETIGPEERTVLFAMFGAVIFVLVIACVNVTNLLMARAMMRAREVGVRTALGASRFRVASQFLAEAFALALLGALGGAGLGALGIRLFNNAIAAVRPPFWIDIRLDAVALFWTFGAALAATVLAGALPALQAARASTQEILKDESRGGSSFRLGRISGILVAVEMALSVGLLVGAGLMIKTVVEVNTIDLGFEPDAIYTARVRLPQQGFDGDGQRRFVEDLLARLRQAGGVEAASVTTGLPGIGSGRATFGIEGVNYMAERDYPSAALVYVSTGFFQTVSVDMLSGRDISIADRTGAPLVAIVNRAFERRHFPDGSALGMRIRIGGPDSPFPWATIVGVAPDLYASGIENDLPEAIYEPIAQIPSSSFSILGRVRGDPAAFAPAMRSILAEIDPDLPLFEEGSLKAVIGREHWYYRLFGSLFISFGLAALFLASVGLYGVMAFSVSRRTREVGVRMALGATTRDVLRLIFGQGLTHVSIGLAIGTAFALAVSRLLSAGLFQVEPRDPTIFASVILVLLATTLLACWVPARRAAAVDPIEAMRVE